MSDNGEGHDDIVVLVDDEGNEHEFALVDRIQVDQYEYAILAPILFYGEDYIDFQEDAYIFRIEPGKDEESLVEVENEAEWNKVAELWEERVNSSDNMNDNGLS